MDYERNISYLMQNGLLEPMVRADHLLSKLNSLPIEAVEEQVEILKQLFGRVGTSPSVSRNFYCDFGCNIFVGNNFYAGPNCTMLDFAPITIGDNCLIGPNVGIYTTYHNIEPTNRHETGHADPISIGNNVWIGGGSTILPGITIGNGAVIGAGSVVTKNVPDNEVWAGNPAKPHV